MLASMYSYRVMVKSISCCCVHGRQVISNLVTKLYNIRKILYTLVASYIPFIFVNLVTVQILIIVGGLPVIRDPPKNQTVMFLFGNETISLHCIADGEGLSYSWKRQNLELPHSATGSATNTLVILRVREEDSGNYQCTVSNRYGTVSSDYASLNVSGIGYI